MREDSVRVEAGWEGWVGWKASQLESIDRPTDRAAGTEAAAARPESCQATAPVLSITKSKETKETDRSINLASKTPRSAYVRTPSRPRPSLALAASIRDGVRGPKGRLEIRVGKGLSDPSRRPTPKGGVWKGGNANKGPKEANKGREEGSAKGLTLKPPKIPSHPPASISRPLD